VRALVSTAGPAVHLVGTATAAAMTDDLAEVAVLDGIDDQQAYAKQSVTIGGTWDPEVQALTADQVVTVETEELGGGRRIRETSSISCIAYSGSGDMPLADHRAVVANILTALRAAYRALHELPDGTPVRVQLAGQQWAHVTDEQGAGVMCMFTVVVVALP
jgi:hypothetical protein